MEGINATNLVLRLIAEITDGAEANDKTPLVGASAFLDSMKLVELCVSLEDEALELGFDFDWTSQSAMSQSRGMFRSVGALAEEFARQSQLSKAT